MNLKSMIGKTYRHFKGAKYEVVEIAECSETLKPMVVYKSVNHGRIWVRDYKNFISEVPEGKPNPTGQVYRFELEVSK